MLQTSIPSCPISWPPKPSRLVVLLCPRPGWPQQSHRNHDPSSLHMPTGQTIKPRGSASPQAMPELYLRALLRSCLGVRTRGKGPDRDGQVCTEHHFLPHCHQGRSPIPGMDCPESNAQRKGGEGSSRGDGRGLLNNSTPTWKRGCQGSIVLRVPQKGGTPKIGGRPQSSGALKSS